MQDILKMAFQRFFCVPYGIFFTIWLFVYTHINFDLFPFHKLEISRKGGGWSKVTLLNEGFKKSLFIHILWISVSPPPSPIQVGGLYNNIMKYYYFPHLLTPPHSPLSTFQFYIIYFF